MTEEIEAEITRLTLAATENGSVGPSIRAAMEFAYLDAVAVVWSFDDAYSSNNASAWTIAAAITDRL